MFRIFVECGDLAMAERAGGALCVSIDAECLAVVKVQSLLCCDPDEAAMILNDIIHGTAAQAIRRTELAKVNVLFWGEGVRCKGKNKARDQERNKSVTGCFHAN